MPTAAQWICEHCRAEHQSAAHPVICPDCETPRFTSMAVMLAEHVLEHVADGLSTPLEILQAMQARPCYQRTMFTLEFIARQLRLLTKDTTQLARDLVRARSARVMLEVLADGEPKDKIQVLAKWGPETNAERVDHNVKSVSTFVIEANDGPPPKDAA